jgi:glycosyltransferase involved in cell wall biosynthesis
MARLAVITSSPPAVEGGHLVIARALVRALEGAGHTAHLVLTPDFGFGRTLETYRANWKATAGDVDQVISLRYPSYAVRHPRHVCWLNHTMREYYDLWPRFAATLGWKNYAKESARGLLLKSADRWLLRQNVTRVVAQSRTIQQRLLGDFNIRAEVVLPPPPQRNYRCEGYDDYVFAVSRLYPLKRIDLLIRALAEPPARRVRAVVAGEGEERGRLAALASQLGVGDRLRLVGRITEDELTEHLARCRVVCFTPLNEDYGFVTAEAFASAKAVITCVDSGGPTELVADGRTGYVVEPTPPALALALARVMDDRRLAENLGGQAAIAAAALTWPATVEQLVIV